jgi:hypothetical protein
MKRIDVVKKRGGWAGESGGRIVPKANAVTKVEAVEKVAAAASKIDQAVSVAIHQADGRIEGPARGRRYRSLRVMRAVDAGRVIAFASCGVCETLRDQRPGS